MTEAGRILASTACRVCGCTDTAACPDGCCWVPDPENLGPLCSACSASVIATAAERILAVTREVVAEVGVRAATTAAVAERAGVELTTVDERWANIGEVILDALHNLPYDERRRDLIRATAKALNALVRDPEGRFLIEVFLLPSGFDALNEATA